MANNPLTTLNLLEHDDSHVGVQLVKAQTVIGSGGSLTLRDLQGDEVEADKTGSESAIAEALLAHLGLRHYFDAVVAADHVKHHKPAPDTFLLCAQRMGVQPTQCVVFEDADFGIQAARAAGMDAPSRLTGSFKHLHLTRGVVLQRQRLTVFGGDAVFCQRIEDDRRKVSQFQHSLNVAG